MPNVRITNIVPSPQETFLFDTNILIHLFYPTMSNAFMKPYEKFYADALRNKSQFILTSIQVSEFVNRCIRFQYDVFLKSNGYSRSTCDFKKDYRGTSDYQNTMNSILEIIKNDIASQFLLVDDHFDSMNLNDILLFGFSYDFNDAFLVSISNFYNSSIVTHDLDFANYSTSQKIITANEKLLRFSRH